MVTNSNMPFLGRLDLLTYNFVLKQGVGFTVKWEHNFIQLVESNILICIMQISFPGQAPNNEHLHAIYTNISSSVSRVVRI